MTANHVRVSIIVPVYNDPQNLRECLAALQATSGPATEILVVDDASTDNTLVVATQMGVRALRLEKNSGPAAARNYGARHAHGEILFFVDADVVVTPLAVARILTTFDAQPDVAAVFGSYDAQPRAKGVVSQYRNLLHHFVHQNGNPEASTFWAGCGAMRNAVFSALGGFDEKRFPRSSIEDIELGHRLRQVGHRIFLDKALQATHLKRWTLRSIVWTDVVCRALPWSRLLLTSEQAPNDLNVTTGQRLSVALVGVASLSLAGALFRGELLAVAVAALAGVVILNRALYTFFFRQQGFLFACLCIPLHLLYYLYSGVSYGYAWFDVQWKSGTLHILPTPRKQ